MRNRIQRQRRVRACVIAGSALWGILVPEGIAYAALAGAPIQAGADSSTRVL
jgi:MFS superfamily sulfate permease-like transporter